MSKIHIHEYTQMFVVYEMKDVPPTFEFCNKKSSVQISFDAWPIFQSFKNLINFAISNEEHCFWLGVEA